MPKLHFSSRVRRLVLAIAFVPALLGAAGPEVRLASGGVECRIGERDELLYLGPQQHAGGASGSLTLTRDSLKIEVAYATWGILARTHTTWLSDEVRPLPSLQLGYGCTVEFAPEVCNHWMVGDRDNGQVDVKAAPGWWDFLFRVPMNGQFGISSRVFDWSPELRRRASENVALYKRLRKVIQGADVYHLTPQPDHDNPRGWMAIEYVQPDGKRAALLAYRLAGGSASQTFRLRGIKAGPITVTLDQEWRAKVLEIEGRP